MSASATLSVQVARDFYRARHTAGHTRVLFVTFMSATDSRPTGYNNYGIPARTRYFLTGARTCAYQ